MKPIKFLNEVKSETKKVTWPTRKETIISTIMVLVMVIIISLFLYFADQIIAWLVSLILGL
ncbi:MAG: preprotein translocase subunit SecE [Micavibrio sp.]|mgnify:FL=1|nr:preprotein translocase subunit SecE [Micavibrio sp.]